jgi:uncharacterized protein
MGPNAETARAAYEAFARGDLDGVLAALDETIEWHEADALPNGGVYHGVDEVRRAVFGQLDGDWEGFQAVPERFVDDDESAVVVLGRYRGTSLRTGAELDVPFAHVWAFRDGRAVRFDQFTDTALWLRARGGD